MFEVVVVDDGDGPPLDLSHALPEELRGQVRCLLTAYRGTGAARSEGFDAAKGEYVAFCDEDCEWAPDHLETLLGWMLDHPETDLVYGGLEEPESGGEAVPPVPNGGDRLARVLCIRPSAAVFRARVVHELGGFDARLWDYEDLDLWLRLLDQGHAVHYVPVAVAQRSPDGRPPVPRHEEDLSRVLAGHERRLVRARDGVAEEDSGREGTATPLAGPPTPVPLAIRTGSVVPFDRGAWGDGCRRLAWHSVLRADEGYGVVGRALLLALEARGVDVGLVPGVEAPRGFERFHRFHRREELPGRPGFYYDHRVRPSVMRCEQLVTYSMWETERVPRDHVEEINAHSSLHLVPCHQNVESHIACGVRVPVKVLHHGVYARRFPLLERPRDGLEPYTFGTFGDLAPRKGIDALVRAFLDEFASHEPVRLLMKSTAPRSAYGADDPRVETLGGFLDDSALLELLRRMDAFVLPSRGEGFGLCGLEAMATGLPLIATGWSGPSEYLDPADSYPLPYELVDAGGTESNNVRYFGRWAEPDHEHLRHLMRRLYENPEEGVTKGRAASVRAHREWTWERVASQLVADLDALVGGVGG